MVPLLLTLDNSCLAVNFHRILYSMQNVLIPSSFLLQAVRYRMVGNFRGVLIFVDFVGPTQTTKNSLKICIDPRKYNFLGLKTTNLSLFHIMHIAMLCSYIAP